MEAIFFFLQTQAGSGIDTTFAIAIFTFLTTALSGVCVAFYRHLLRIIEAHEAREKEYLSTIKQYETHAPRLISIADRATEAVTTAAIRRAPAPSTRRRRAPEES